MYHANESRYEMCIRDRDGTIIKAQEKLVYGEADTVVSGLKRGGSYQFLSLIHI